MLHKYSEVALGLCIHVDLVEFCGFFSLEKTAFDSVGRARKGQKHLLSVIVKVLKCLYLHRFAMNKVMAIYHTLSCISCV